MSAFIFGKTLTHAVTRSRSRRSTLIQANGRTSQTRQRRGGLPRSDGCRELRRCRHYLAAGHLSDTLAENSAEMAAWMEKNNPDPWGRTGETAHEET